MGRGDEVSGCGDMGNKGRGFTDMNEVSPGGGSKRDIDVAGEAKTLVLIFTHCRCRSGSVKVPESLGGGVSEASTSEALSAIITFSAPADLHDPRRLS